MKRQELPNRRFGVTESINWMGNRVHLRAGFNPADGKVAELWISGGKAGSEFSALADEFAILISRFLQSGMSVEDVQKIFGRLDDGTPASIAGAAADWLSSINRVKPFDEA